MSARSCGALWLRTSRRRNHTKDNSRVLRQMRSSRSCPPPLFDGPNLPRSSSLLPRTQSGVDSLWRLSDFFVRPQSGAHGFE